MSVAFRRESDEEHLEPKFERPIPPGPNLVTARGLALLAAEVEAGTARLETAAIEERDALARDLRYWRSRLATAQRAPSPAAGEAGIGSHVRFTLRGREREIEIVGTDEADQQTARVGFMAPLAQALLGGVAGDMAAFGGEQDAIEIHLVIDPDP